MWTRRGPDGAYNNKKTGGSHKSGAEQKYPCLSMTELAHLPIASIAAKDAVCALWATTPFGGVPYTLLDAWGFEYKTELYWRKTGRKGTGYWTRGCVEKLLIGIRGKVPAWRSSVDNWQEFTELDDLEPVEAMPLGHSKKPAGMIRLLEQLTPQVERRVELFATRHSVEVANAGDVRWDCYGLDLGHDFRFESFWDGLIHPQPVEQLA